jgi:phosphate transport system permease protein
MLPNAIPGILTSIILSIGRIIGESAALIFAIGTSIQDDINITKGSTTLAVHIWSVVGGENPNYSQACAISIIILGIVLVLNILVKLVSIKLNKFEVKR